MMADATRYETRARSGTMPTKASTSTNSSLRKSKRVLVYDFAENKTHRMSRAKFEKEYSDACEIIRIPIPKGASRVDISPDDLSPEAQDFSSQDSVVPSHINTSYTASVHIPSVVFWARAIVSPDLYPELTIVSNSSPNSSRSNTSRMNTINSMNESNDATTS